MFKLGNACHVWRLWHHLARKPHRGFWQFPNVLQNGGRVKYFLKNTPTRGTENISTRTAIPLGLPSILCTDQPQWTSLTLRSVWMVPWGCAIDWIVMSPPQKKFIYWNLTLNVIVFGSGDFGRWLDHESGTLMNGMRAFIKHRTP